MSVDVSHFILESLRNTNNEVVDEGLHSTKRGDRLASAMV